MPLTLYRRPSFERSLRSLGAEQITVVGCILEAIELYYSSNCNLEAARKIAPRFFYKQLRRPYYEAGIESKIRVVLEREGEKCIAVLAGSHDEIKRFLHRT